MKVKQLIALALALVLVFPVSVFAAASENNNAGTEDFAANSVLVKGSKMDLQKFIEMSKELRKENSKKLGSNTSKIGSLLKEKGEFVANENAIKEEEYFKPDDKVRIIVEVSGKPVRNLSSISSVNKLKSKQKSIMAAIEDNRIAADFRHQFVNGINGFSAEVKYSDVKEIRNLPGVTKVYISRKYEMDMNTSRGMVNADVVNAATYNLKGEGTLVAIIDTGIDWTHQDLSNITDPSKAKYPNEGSISAKLAATAIPDKWYNEKVVSGYDWADMDDDVIPDLSKPSASPHGVHVAGTVAANGSILGVAPEAQLLAEKVFSDGYEGAYDDDIIAGIEHAVAFGADVINMSLGSNAGFVGDDDPIQPALQAAEAAGVIACVSAGNSGYNTKGLYYPLAQNPDIGLVGSPGVGTATIQVASMENNIVVASSLDYYYNEVKQGNGAYQDAGNINPASMNGIKLVDCGRGTADNFTNEVKEALAGSVALIERGTNTFAEKQINAQNAGALGVVIYNHSDGGDELISMATHEELVIPAVFIGRTTGLVLLDGIKAGNKVSLGFSGKVTSIPNPAAGQMSDFSAWGLTPNLDFKPEITAPGGNIYSTVNGNKYETMSGTSMSSPHAAGAAALVAQYLKSTGLMDSEGYSKSDMLSVAKALLMNTALPIENPVSEGDTPYSPRLQGAGLMQIDKAISTPVVALNPGISLKEIDESSKIEVFPVSLTAFSSETVSEAVYYNVYADIYTDYVYDAGGGYKFNLLETTPVEGAKLELNGKSVLDTVYETVYVEKGSSIQLDFTLDLSGATIPTESFVEGFIRFVPTEANPDIPTLTVPYVGFYGDWDKPNNVDPAAWEYDSYGGYTGLYEPVPVRDDKGKFLYYSYNQLGWDFAGKNISPENVAISPNKDSFQDVGITVFTLLRNAKRFKLYAEDKSGNLVKNIFDNLTWKNKAGVVECLEGIRKNSTYSTGAWYTLEPGVFEWDGTSDSGSNVVDGQYKVVIETTIDYPGAQPQRYELPVKVDTVEPTVTNLAVNPSGETYTISWESSDDYSGVVYSDVFIDGYYYDTVDTNSITVAAKPTSVIVVAWDYAGNPAVAGISSTNTVRAVFDKNISKRSNIVVTINGVELKEIRNGSTVLTENIHYAVSDSIKNLYEVKMKKEYLAKLSVGTATLTFDFASGNDWNLVISIVDSTHADDDDDDNQGGNGNGNGNGGNSTTPSTPAAPANPPVTPGKPVEAPAPKLDPNTKEAETSITAETLNSAFSAAEANSEGVKEIAVAVPKVEGANAYTLAMPTALLASDSENVTGVIEMQTALGTVAIPNNMLTPEMAAKRANVGISLGLADTTALSSELKSQLGSKPVFELNLKVNGTKTEWNNPNASVTVSVSYKPTEEELQNPDNIVVWYIDGTGNAVSVPNGKYDPATGMVTFSVNHFSKYAIAYAKPALSDIRNVAWASKEISAMAAKGVLKPVSKKVFDPKTDITRADFIYGLVRALGLNRKFEGNFSDVKTTDYYYSELGTAKKLGITTGIGNNKFAPDSSITRQDMMTLTARALKIAKKLKGEGSDTDLNKFADNTKIASYARTSIESVVAEGIIQGDGTNINPLGNTSRAEAAVIMYRIYNK